MNPFEKGICTNHTGKMKGIWSFSTSVLDNPICARRANLQGSICQHCYARAQLSYQHSTDNKCRRNADLVSTRILSDRELPVICYPYFRWESFGDLKSTEQAINYLSATAKNPDTLFSWFTKNPWFIAEALEKGAPRPDNLTIVISSPFINKPLPVDIVKRIYPFADIVFTVYDSAEHTPITCGGRSCLSCLRCYTAHQRNRGKVEAVAELLKGKKD